MIELSGLKKVRERIRQLEHENRTDSSAYSRVSEDATREAFEQFQSDLRAIVATIREAQKGRGHTYTRDRSNGEYYMSMTLINQLISAIDSALKVEE